MTKNGALEVMRALRRGGYPHAAVQKLRGPGWRAVSRPGPHPHVRTENPTTFRVRTPKRPMPRVLS